MERYRADIRQIEKLILENKQRKEGLRAENSRRMLLFAFIFGCILLALYQI